MIAKKCFNWIRVLVLFVVFALLAACARFEPRPIAPDVTAAAFEARSLSDADLKRFLEAHLKRELRPWPAKTWDMMMLTLTALYYHPDMDLARARWAVAEAGVITAGQRPNPTVGMSATRVFTGVPSGVFPWVLGLSFDIPIETAGKRGYRIAQARQLSKAAQLNLAQVAWQVRSRMRASLLSLLAAERAHAISQRRLALQEGIVKLLEQRLILGEASQPEVTQARIALNQEALTGRELQKQVAEARVQLATAVGLPASALADVTLGFAPLEQTPRVQQLPSSEVRRHGLINRADILSALAAYEASEATLQQEIARQYPDVRLGPGYSWELGENRWTLAGIALTLPVFQQNQGPIAEAEARRREAAARFNALQAQALSEIDRSLASARAALNKLVTADALAAQQERQLRSAQNLFAAGESDRLAVLSSQLEREVAARGRLDALIGAQQALGQVEDAVQRPLDHALGALVDTSEEPIATEVAVHVGKIVRATLRRYVEAYGMIEPEPAFQGKPPASARVATPVAGVVAEAHCEEGQRVNKGATLFVLDSRAVEVQIEKARVAVEFARKNLERKQQLIKTENISRKLFEEAQQQLAAARKDLATAQTQRSLLKIQAPLSGTITRVNVKPGEAVDLNAALVELIDLDRLVVNATVPSAEVYRLRPGQPVEVSERREADGAEAVDAPSRRGAIAFIGLEIDPKTDTVAVRSALPPGSGVRPGQLVKVRIVTEERQGRLAVPVESVVTVDGTPVIALVADDHATQRPVKLGLRDGELVEIEAEGLQEGMTVVTAGAYGLPRDTRVRVLLP